MKTGNLNIFLNELSEYLGSSDLNRYFIELSSRPNVIDEIEKKVADEDYFETKSFRNIYEFRLYRIILYLLIRTVKPKISVETGVLHGLTTQFLLNAIFKNDEGQLYSIDYPSYYGLPPANKDGFKDTLPPNREPGWIVSEKYHNSWELYKGKSSELLPDLLKKAGLIDLFIHDSEHTYDTMIFELNLAWDNLKTGAVLVCDNINCNTSFFDFCRKINKIPFIGPYDVNDINSGIRFGILKK